MDKFRTKAGRLTDYAFSCGYIEKVEINEDKYVILSKDSCYHVKAINWEIKTSGEPVWNDTDKSRVWLSCRTLTEARKLYAGEIRRLKNV